MERIVALVLGTLVGGFGFWLGEGGLPPWAVVPMTGGVLGCFAAGLIAPGTLWRRVLVGAAFLVLYAAAYFWGLQSFRRAFNECVERGEEVRSLLREHYQRKDQYPERLNELERSLPCGRIARPTVLEYKKTKGGYVLTFRDWLVEHSASESSAFLASK